MITNWRMSGILACLIAVLAFPGPAFGEGAGADEKAPERPWNDTLELSVVNTGGNTRVTTLAIKNDFRYRVNDRLSATWRLAVVYGESDGTSNAENYMTELRGDYVFSERIYGFDYLSWTRDTFAGIDSKTSAGLGPGYRFLTGPRHTLLGEAGFSYTAEDTDAETEDYFGGRLFGNYRYNFLEKSSLSQSLEWLVDFGNRENWNLNSETALVTQVNGYVNLKVSYTAKYDKEPVGGLDELDTVLAAVVVLSL